MADVAIVLGLCFVSFMSGVVVSYFKFRKWINKHACYYCTEQFNSKCDS